MALSDILLRITADSSAFSQEMSRVNSDLAKIDRAVTKTTGGFTAFGTAMSSFGSTLTAAVTLPIIGLGVGAIKASADLDTLQRALVATTGSASKAKEQFDRLQEIAKLPGIGLEEAVRGSIRLQNYGLSAGLAEHALRNFSNAVAAGGGSAEDTAEALRQLGQMYGRGKVTMDNLRIILERVPQAAAIIKKEWGSEALADPAKAFEALGLTSQQVIETLIKRMDDVPRVSAGVKTGLENLAQEVQKAAGRIGDKLTPSLVELLPKLESAATGVADLVDAFTKLPEPVQTAGLALGGIAIASGPITWAIGNIVKSIGFLKTGATAVSSAFSAIAGGITLVGSAAVAAAAAAAGFLYWLGRTPTATEQQKKASDEAAEGMKRINERMGTGAKAAGDMVIPFGLAAEGIINFAKELPATEKAITPVTEAVGELGKAMKSAKLPTMDMQALQLISKDVEKKREEQIRFLADTMERYGVVTAEAAMKAAKALDILHVSYRQLSDAPDLGNLNQIDFAKLPKAAKPDLPSPASFEEFVRMGKNVGPEGMLTKEQTEAIKSRYKDVSTTAKAAMRQISTVVTDLSRGIADVIFKGGKIGDMLQDVAKQAGKAIVRELIEGALKKLTAKLIDVGGLFGKVFGGASSGGGGISGMLGGGSGGGSAASGVAGAAVSGVVGMVSGVVSAISSVIGNFQMMAMNKSLDLIEHEVRYSQIHLLNTLNKANEYWPYMKSVWESLIRMETAQQGFAGGGGGTVNVSMAGAYLMSDSQMGDFADRLARFLKARGL